MIEQANFGYSSLAKPFEKQTKTKKSPKNKKITLTGYTQVVTLSNQVVELK